MAKLVTVIKKKYETKYTTHIQVQAKLGKDG